MKEMAAMSLSTPPSAKNHRVAISIQVPETVEHRKKVLVKPGKPSLVDESVDSL